MAQCWPSTIALDTTAREYWDFSFVGTGIFFSTQRREAFHMCILSLRILRCSPFGMILVLPSYSGRHCMFYYFSNDMYSYANSSTQCITTLKYSNLHGMHHKPSSQHRRKFPTQPASQPARQPFPNHRIPKRTARNPLCHPSIHLPVQPYKQRGCEKRMGGGGGERLQAIRHPHAR